MTAQYGRPSLFDRLKAFAWWGEQKLVNALAVTFGVTIGLAQGSIHATKSLAPHFTSTAGLKHLYYGDPAASLSSQSQAYVRGSFASARLKSSGEMLDTLLRVLSGLELAEFSFNLISRVCKPSLFPLVAQVLYSFCFASFIGLGLSCVSVQVLALSRHTQVCAEYPIFSLLLADPAAALC